MLSASHLLLQLSTLVTMMVLVQSAKMVNQEEIMKMKKEADQHQETKKEELLEELQEAQILKEWEIIVKNLDDEQLDNIEDILAKNLERNREFEMIMLELKAMGMDEQDISDLKQLAEFMHEFLIQIPNLKIKLEIANNNDLLDNIQVFSIDLSSNVTICALSAVFTRTSEQVGSPWLRCPSSHS